jgi:hypothetical protein
LGAVSDLLAVTTTTPTPCGNYSNRLGSWGKLAVLKKLLIIAGLVGVAALVVKKVKASSDERALWHEATTAPDLR